MPLKGFENSLDLFQRLPGFLKFSKIHIDLPLEILQYEILR